MEKVFPKNSEVSHPLLDHGIEVGTVESIQHNKDQKNSESFHQFQMSHRDAENIARDSIVNRFVHGRNTVDYELDLEGG